METIANSKIENSPENALYNEFIKGGYQLQDSKLCGYTADIDHLIPAECDQ